MKFYISIDCANCGEEVIDGLCLTLLEHRGLPVVKADIFEQTTFDCGECGATNYTGDLDLAVDEAAL